jgi:hypothetical protein
LNPIDGFNREGAFIMKKMYAIIMSVFLCLFLFNQLDQQQNHVYAQKNLTLQYAQEQWEQLWKVGSQLTEGPAHITVKWQGAWSSSLTSEEAAASLANSLGFAAPTAEYFQGHQQYASVQATEDVKSTFTLTEQADGKYYVMVRVEAFNVEAFNKEALDKLDQLQGNYGAILIEAGVGIQWNGAIQGELISSAESRNLNHGGNQKKELGVGKEIREVREGREGPESTELITAKLESFMKMQWKEVTGVDQYQDGNTMSLSYHVGDLPLAVVSGEQRINIQLALHQSSDSDKQEVSIGSPLLTIEY